MTGDDVARLSYVEVRRLFERMLPPASTTQLAYVTEPLLGSDLRLAKNQSGGPCLLLPDAVRGTRAANRHYANMRVRHGLRLRLREHDEVRVYSVVECVSDDPVVRDWFLRLVPSLAEHLVGVAAGDFSAIEEQIARVGELFRLIDAQPVKSLHGLWGELALIASAQDIASAVVAWHKDATAVHDFTSAGAFAEVKLSVGSRSHRFSTQQLEPAADVLIVSWVVEAADDGLSVMDLYEHILAALTIHPDLQEKVQALVLRFVGMRLSAADEVRFDFAAALSNARCFVADAIPHPAGPFPVGVSDVHFTADLSQVEPLPIEVMSARALWKSFVVDGAPNVSATESASRRQKVNGSQVRRG